MITVQEPVRVSLLWDLNKNKQPQQLQPSHTSVVAVETPKSTYSSTSFPMSSDLSLRDSPKSIRIGLRNAVASFQRLSNINDHYMKSTDSLESSDYEDVMEDEIDEDEDLEHETQLEAKLPGHSLLKPSKTPNSLLPLVQRRLQRLIEERFSIPSTTAFKSCIVNLVLQDFESDDLGTIYNKLFRKEGKERVLHIIENTFMEKYPSEQLDKFYDELYLSISGANDCLDIERPNFYHDYAAIWLLDREGFKDYNYNCFVEYVEEQYHQQLESDDLTNDDLILHEYVSQGFLMNVEKFYYYFNRNIKPGKVVAKRRGSISNSNGIDPRNNSIGNIMKGKMSKIVKSTDDAEAVIETIKERIRPEQNLRFESMSVVLDYSPEEPPIYVNYDKECIEW
ncbi:hypothetical protein CAAN1_08S04720 [[Candida] anglica]|uniref:Cullin N-terminal domain-containing protein n=1 Tax=[Candida] anglica TaxID=148631 RepID=A0ABP0E5L5_9ASCO